MAVALQHMASATVTDDKVTKVLPSELEHNVRHELVAHGAVGVLHACKREGGRAGRQREGGREGGRGKGRRGKEGKCGHVEEREQRRV